MDNVHEQIYHSINNIKSMEVIDINTGAKLGVVKDFTINIKESRINSLIIPSPRTTWLNRINDINILWKDIKKIGIDVILVDGKGVLDKLNK